MHKKIPEEDGPQRGFSSSLGYQPLVPSVHSRGFRRLIAIKDR